MAEPKKLDHILHAAPFAVAVIEPAKTSSNDLEHKILDSNSCFKNLFIDADKDMLPETISAACSEAISLFNNPDSDSDFFFTEIQAREEKYKLILWQTEDKKIVLQAFSAGSISIEDKTRSMLEQYKLAEAYYSGEEGIVRNYEKAYFWDY